MLFLDGLMIPMSKSVVHQLSPGVVAGKGVFETMRSYDGRIFAVTEHLARLNKGLHSLGLHLPCTTPRTKQLLIQSLTSNKLRNARIRLTVWKQKGKTRMSVVVLPYHPFSSMKYRQGFSAVISDIRRDENSKAVRIKSINYLPLILAWRRARIKGSDEALFLNRKGFLVEGSRTNLFFVKDGNLHTPKISCGCLNGITRQLVLRIARQAGIKSVQGCALPEDLYSAQEAFLTNSLIEIMPLTSVQGKLIGDGRLGPLTAKLSKAYKAWVKRALFGAA